MKLEKFDKNKNRKIIVASVVLGLFLIIGGVYLFRSHAIFEEHKTFDVIFGKVPPFKKKEKDLELAILVDGESVSEAPTGGDYRVRVECDTEEISGEWNYSTKKAHISGDITKPAVCTIIFESIYDSITVDGESRNTFPEKGDYQYNMTCSNVTDYSWNEDTWTPTVTGVNKSSSCNLVFKSTNNIITKITFDGEERSSYPSKEDTGSVEIKCTPNTVIGEWDKENWKVKKINNVTNETICEVAFSSKPSIYDVTSVGDYVAYTPSKSSYTISGTSTNCEGSSKCSGASSDGSQTVNPSELNLWRVIKKNETDGTIEIVSEYTSSNNIYFYGIEGYKRFVGTLNEIASAYETEGITRGARIVGNTGEQETCADVPCDYERDYTKETPDTKLIKSTFGTLLSNSSSSPTTPSRYWIGSRYYKPTQNFPNGSQIMCSYSGRSVDTYGSITDDGDLYGCMSPNNRVYGCSVRVVIVLNGSISSTALEDKADTYQNKTFKQWKVN